VHNFQPDKWYLSGSESDLLKNHGFACHVLKTGDSIGIPNNTPPCVHSLTSAIDLNIPAKEISPNCWLSETQVSQQPIVTNNTTPMPVSPEYFGVSLHEHIKVEPGVEQPALLAYRLVSVCRGRQQYFELKRDSNELLAFNVEGRLQLFQCELVIEFLECTQFFLVA
jgi:hypothetical protein